VVELAFISRRPLREMKQHWKALMKYSNCKDILNSSH